MGRPRKAEADRRSEVLAVRATKADVDAAYRLARRRGCTLTELLQACLRQLAIDDAIASLSVVQKLGVGRKGRILASVAVH
jgi:hypothetical protein